MKKITVHDVQFIEEPILRSRKVLAHRKIPSYLITRDTEIETVTATDLKFFKKIWGPNCLSYEKPFEEKHKQKFII